MGLEDWYKGRAESDRAEVSEWFKTKAGQWTLWLVLGLLACWLAVSAARSLL